VLERQKRICLEPATDQGEFFSSGSAVISLLSINKALVPNILIIKAFDLAPTMVAELHSKVDGFSAILTKITAEVRVFRDDIHAGRPPADYVEPMSAPVNNV
jgi:hypothetical protein